MRNKLVNLPNILTVFRIAVLPLLAVLLQKDMGLWACVVLTVAGVSDILDGWIARQYKMETAFGKLLDPVADKLLLCVAVIYLMVAQHAVLSPMLATLILAREFLVTGLRAMAAAEGLVIGAGTTGKFKTLSQMVGLGALMISGFPLGLPADLIGISLLWVAVILSYWSMWQYSRAAYLALKDKLS